MERYEKTVAPRVAEEERALQLEEQGMQRRRAAAEDAADSAAVEQQCGKILALVDVSDISGGLPRGGEMLSALSCPIAASLTPLHDV